MKRAKGFVILAAIASLVFGSFVVYGAETAPASTPAATETVTKKVTYAPLEVKAIMFQNDRAEDLGTYPEITGYDELNAEIASKVFSEYLLYGTTAQDDFSQNNYLVSYKVDDAGQFATITISRSYYWGYTDVVSSDSTMVYIIDKDTKKVLTEEKYKALLADQKEAEAKAATEQQVMASLVFVPLEEVASILGLAVEDTDKADTYTVTSGKTIAQFSIGSNQYYVGKKVLELEVAPLLFEENVYVPNLFFEKAFGATLKTDTDGIISIELNGKTAQAEVLYEIVDKDAAVTEEPATDPTIETAVEEPTMEEPAVDEPAAIEEPAMEMEEIVVVPARQYIEQLGYAIAESAVNNKNHRTFQVTKGDFTAIIALDENNYTVNGEAVTLDSAPVLKDGSLYLPVSFFTDVLGVTVDDNGDGTFTFVPAEAAE